MKTIILIAALLLTSLSAVAQIKVTIIADAPRTDVMEFEKPNKKKAIKRLKNLVRKSQWLKGAWQEKKKDSIFLRKDMEDKIEYFHPSNFRVIFTDVTEKRKQDKSKKDKKAKNKKDLIDIIKKKDLNLKQINKLLREIL